MRRTLFSAFLLLATWLTGPSSMAQNASLLSARSSDPSLSLQRSQRARQNGGLHLSGLEQNHRINHPLDDSPNKDDDGPDLLTTRLVYNFFRGPNYQDFRTSVQGLGSISGLLGIDNIFLHTIVPMTSFKRLNLSAWQGTPIGIFHPYLGFIAKKYRFEKFKYHSPDTLASGQSQSDSELSYLAPDERKDVDYQTGFFRHNKSKMVVSCLRFAPEAGILFGMGKQGSDEQTPVTLTIGPVLDWVIRFKMKNKYTRNGSNEKDKKTGVDYFNVNELQYGVSYTVSIGQFSTYGAFMLNPLFNSDFRYGSAEDVQRGAIYAAEIGVEFDFNLLESRK